MDCSVKKYRALARGSGIDRCGSKWSAATEKPVAGHWLVRKQVSPIIFIVHIDPRQELNSTALLNVSSLFLSQPSQSFGHAVP